MVRRIVKWAAGTVLTVSVTAWVVSLWHVIYTGPSGLTVGLMGGKFVACRLGFQDMSGWEVIGFRPPGWDWWPRWTTTPSRAYWALFVPLWMPAAGTGIVLGAAWLADRRGCVRAQEGFCSSCGYDLAGITGPCPECGRAR